MTLRKTVIISFLLLTLAGSTSLLITALSFSSRSLKSVLEDDMKSMVSAVSEAISAETDSKFQLINAVSHIPDIQNSKSTLIEKQSILNSIAKNENNITDFIITDIIGKTAYEDTNWKNFNPRFYISEALMGKKTIQGPITNKADNTSALFYCAPLYNENNKIENVIFMPTNGEVLSDFCSRYKVGKTGYSFVLDRSYGSVIGHPDVSLVYDQYNLYQKTHKNPDLAEEEVLIKDMMNGNSAVGYYTEDSVKYVLSYAPIPGTNWSAGVVVEYSEFYSHLTTLRHIMIALTVIISILSILISLYIAKSIGPLKKVGQAINEIATGNADLTQRLEFKHTKKEITEVVNGFNNFVEKLQSIISNVKFSQNNLITADNSLQVNSQETVTSITQIISSIENVNSHIGNQVSSVNETAGAVNQIATNINSLEKLIINQASGIEEASSAIEEMVGNINSVNNSVEKMFDSFKILEENARNGIEVQGDVNSKIRIIEEQSKMLQDANQAIADIAEQTNLLAMNAAIESAHAGDVGKGFAVVADEIRKLSETSTEQSNSIGNELKKIQESISDVVKASDISSSAFNSVAQNIQTTDEIVRQIKNAMDEQIVGSKQITEALQSINDSTTEVRSASTEMTSGNKHILSEIQKLQTSTTEMRDSIFEMSKGAQKINETAESLSDVSNQVTSSIDGINQEINLFKV